MKTALRMLCLGMILLALGTNAWAEEDASVAEPMAAPQKEIAASDPEVFGLGVCLGQGAGLLGAYMKFNPIDHLGFEATVGKRMFLLVYNDELEVYWPTNVALKARYYFMERTRRFNPGIEAGAMFTEDLGTGGEVSGICTFRINKHLHLDASLGIGSMPNAKSNQIDYLVKVRGRTRAYYENNASFTYDSPIMLFAGLGIAFMF